MKKSIVPLICCVAFGVSAICEEARTNLETENLVAWCIVPFDASQRSPSERAAMLVDLGIRRSAYDWRERHVAEFEDEIREYKKRGIEFFAFWSEHEKAFELFEKHGIHPQIWKTAPSPEAATQADRLAAAVEALRPLAERTGRRSLKLGLYNHGGWGGEPENLVAVCDALRELGHDHVGIVYNWHHGHDRIPDWKTSLALLQPYLLCLNLNGMNDHAEPKILPLGEGKHDAAMFEVLIESGYDGPIGILDHRDEMDTREALELNLSGLAQLKKRFGAE